MSEDVRAIVGSAGRATGVMLASGETLPADLVVVAVGVEPEVGLPRDAGLTADRAIRVDARLRTSDPSIWAAGDVATVRLGPGRELHSEHWANAIAGGRTVDGQPFAPGLRLSPEEEAARVLPVIRELRSATAAVLSVDTFEPLVAEQCLAAGADAVNDTTGLRNPRLVAVIADAGAHVVLTHSLAPPRTVIPPPRYTDVVAEVRDYLERQAEHAIAAGIREECIAVDPGHDLNKNTLHSIELTRRFGEIAALGFPTVASVSNKDFVGETLGAPVGGRLAGSLAAAVACVLQGVRIVRMHDVPAASAALRMTEAILGLRRPALLRHNVDPDDPPEL